MRQSADRKLRREKAPAPEGRKPKDSAAARPRTRAGGADRADVAEQVGEEAAIKQVAAELGIRVPEDLSVIGFDDIPEASQMTPALTTIRQPMQRLGTTAVDLLMSLMGGTEPDAMRAGGRCSRLMA